MTLIDKYSILLFDIYGTTITRLAVGCCHYSSLILTSDLCILIKCKFEKASSTLKDLI